MIVAKGEVLPAAADDALRPLLTGPVRPAKLLAVVTDAVHLQVGSTLVVVCGPSAVRLPGSVTVAAPLSTILDLDVLDPATVGAGHLVLGRRALSVRRWMAAPRPRLRNVAAAVRRARTVDVPAAPALLEQALRGETDVNTTIAGMIGLGPGLTPAGDDIVAGALLALTAANDPRSVRSAPPPMTSCTGPQPSRAHSSRPPPRGAASLKPRASSRRLTVARS